VVKCQGIFGGRVVGSGKGTMVGVGGRGGGCVEGEKGFSFLLGEGGGARGVIFEREGVRGDFYWW